jgi:hypothetical protein
MITLYIGVSIAGERNNRPVPIADAAELNVLASTTVMHPAAETSIA